MLSQLSSPASCAARSIAWTTIMMSDQPSPMLRVMRPSSNSVPAENSWMVGQISQSAAGAMNEWVPCTSSAASGGPSV